jgi:hypothetical protein
MNLINSLSYCHSFKLMGTCQNKAIPYVTLPNQHGWISNVITEYDVRNRKVVNEYKSLDRIGMGTYGTVFKVFSRFPLLFNMLKR